MKSKEENPDREEVLRAYLTELAKKGGKARAAKYDAETLSKWAKKGGRPLKKSQPNKNGGR